MTLWVSCNISRFLDITNSAAIHLGGRVSEFQSMMYCYACPDIITNCFAAYHFGLMHGEVQLSHYLLLSVAKACIYC